MIETVAFWFIRSPWGRYIAGAVALLSALAVFAARTKRNAVRKERDRQRRAIEERASDGIDTMREETRRASGDDVRKLVDRMRGRDRAWRRLPRLF